MIPSPTEQAQLEALVIQEVERRVGDLRRELKEELDALRERTVGNRVTVVVFSGDLDRLMAALVIATGAASMGMAVSLFFTFWGLSALKKERRLAGKSAMEKAFSLMTPTGIGGLRLQDELRGRRRRDAAQDDEGQGRGQRRGAVRDGARPGRPHRGLHHDHGRHGHPRGRADRQPRAGGVATYLGDASDSKVTLFI